MARSKKAKETFRLQVVERNGAQGTSSVIFPGYMLVNRTYSSGKDSQGGNWYQLCPNLFNQPVKGMTVKHKDGRALLAQFDGLDRVTEVPAGAQFDYKG